ncbi:hypothetical protein IBX65_04755 [Candidatus Aerophobetes bacterium]|nr:hypothetical protein [Candidatus Aerophobetes bacterium]
MSILESKGTLAPIQRNLLMEFGKISEASFFYLTGGTALAEFYIGHRRSYDLDLFTTEKGLILSFTRVVEEMLHKGQYFLKVIRRFESFVEYEVSKEEESAVLHFAYDSPFRFEEPQPSKFGVKINDYKDLIVDKLLTFFGRWKHRDAIDLYFILRTEPIETLIEMAKQKDPGFDLYWLCAALREVSDFPDEIGKWPVDMLVEVNVKELKNKFLHLTYQIMDKIKTGER